MNTPSRRLLVRLSGGTGVFLLSGAGALGADVPATLPIDRVTVYREGAAVTRSGAVEIPAGAHRLVIRGLPAAIDAKSLRVAIDSPTVRVGGIEVHKINEGKFSSEAERELRQKIEEASDRRQVARDEVATAQTQLKLLDSLAANPSGSQSQTSVDAADLGTVLATISSGAGAAHQRVREASVQLRAIHREIEKLKADLAKVATQSKQSTELRTAVEAGGAATATVSVSYTIADAGWTWICEARLDTKTKRMTLDRQGQVQQGSGEDWRNVQVTLTTAQPADDLATAVVRSEFLDLESPQVARFAAADANFPASAPMVTLAAKSREAEPLAGRRRQARELATDYLAEYQIPGRVTVMADREQRLYPIAADAFDVALVARVVPGAHRAAQLEASFKYDRDVPLESGRLQLYRDGAFVGESTAKVFLPGAVVRMPFGADQRVRVAVRDEAGQSEQRGVISKQIVKETRRRYDITNFHLAAIQIEVIDQVPVSKHADVKVEILKGATEPTTKDLDGKAGVMMWKFTGEPQKTVAIRQYFSVQYPRDRRLEASREDDSE